MSKEKNKYGQYMTPEIVANFMISIAQVDENAKILEPSSGKGIFIENLLKRWYRDITAYEIDHSITNLDHNVIIKSFVSENIAEKYDLVIWNPPYIRWKNLEEELKKELENCELWNKYCNSLSDYSCIFIIKAIELLKEGGKLVFITPEYWLNTTHSKDMRNYMLEQGYFEEIFHFNETPIFEDASVSSIIFKYVKSSTKNKNKINVSKYFLNRKLNENILENLRTKSNSENTEHLSIPQFERNKRWLLASPEIIQELAIFESHCNKSSTSEDFCTIKDICDIGNGMVSGLDKAFQIDGLVLSNVEEWNTIQVVKAKHLKRFYHDNETKYIFPKNIKDEQELKTDFPNFYKHLQVFRKDLEKRYQYNRDIHYWDWVFLRNMKLFDKDTQKIFVPCKERISNKNYFRFSLVNEWVYPTQDVTGLVKKDNIRESIYYILAFLNSKMVFDWLRFNGVVKWNIVEFSEKPIASIPFRRIDFTNKNEAIIHENIVRFTQEFIKSKKKEDEDQIMKEVDKLFPN